MNTYFMQKPRLFAASLGAMALALLPSCQDEDFGYTTEEIRQEVYNRNFKEIFGDVDPDHNWSMAQNVKVNINVPGATGYEVRILTEAPTNREAIILYDGFMTSDQLTVNVDVISGKRDVYVEVKNAQLGVWLIDGYYTIGEDGMVNTMSASTRAGGSVPSTIVYTATLMRWNRYWDESASVPDNNWYSYDWAFKNNKELRFEYIAPGGKWSAYNSTNFNNNGSNPESSVTLDDGPNSVNRAVSTHVFSQTGTIVCSGLNIPQDWATLYIPLINYNSSGQVKVKIRVLKGDENTLVKEWEHTVSTSCNYNVNQPLNYDVVKCVFDNSNTSFWTAQKLEIQIVDNSHLICGGLFIESFQYDQPSYTDNINGWVTYKDVRGGAVNLWLDKNHLELFNGDTKRCYGNNVFKYRTFDTRKMVYQVGDEYNNNKLSSGDEQLGKSFVAEGRIGPFYEINGDVNVGTEEIKYADMFPLYGLYKSQDNGAWKGSPFREGDNHIDPYFTDYLPATDFEMQKDAQIVTIGAINSGEVQYDGSVSIKMVGMGTDWNNDVGYFYYPKSAESELMRVLPNGEKALDFNKIPKIVIKRDMQGQIVGQKIENLTSGDVVGDYSRVWLKNYAQSIDVCYAMSLSGEDLTSLLQESKFSNYQSNQFDVRTIIDAIKGNSTKKQAAADAKFKAPTYKLPFYGWQSSNDNKYYPDNSKATYVWPKDYVIGFFGIRTDDMVAAELARIYTTSASVERNYFNDIPRGSMFSYKGKNYIGLEDEWDYDNNDVLFEIQGIQSIDPDLTPEDDKTTNKTIQNWIVACEDLGGVWDYDFNDLIWAVSKEVNTTTTIKSDGTKTESGTTDIYFRALAAGGTLKANVQYNTSIALRPGETGWDDNAWVDLGEIHALVSKNPNAPTGQGAQLNVTAGTQITLSQVGDRIKIGSTIPTTSTAVDITSILSHFRIVVEDHDQAYYTITQQTGASHNEHAGSLNYGNGQTNAPQFLLLPAGWAWPAEGVCITDVYSLKSWVQYQNTDWYWEWRNTRKGQNNFVESPALEDIPTNNNQ